MAQSNSAHRRDSYDPAPSRWGKVPRVVATDAGLSRGALRVYVLLACYAREGRAFPKVGRHLAKELGIDRRNVQRSLRELEVAGYIERSAWFRPKVAGGGNGPNTYKLVDLQTGATSSAAPPATGATSSAAPPATSSAAPVRARGATSSAAPINREIFNRPEQQSGRRLARPVRGSPPAEPAEQIESKRTRAREAKAALLAGAAGGPFDEQKATSN